MEFSRDLDLLIRSRYPLVYIPTPEEQRAEDAIRGAAQKITPPRQVLMWDFVDGYDIGGGAKEDPLAALEFVRSRPADQSWVFVLRDFHRFLDDVRVGRKLRNLVRTLRSERKTIVLLSPSLKVPPDIAEDVTVLDFPLPTNKEIGAEMEQLLPKDKIKLDANSREALIKACQGLTMTRVRQVLAKAVAIDGVLDESDIALVLEEKKQKIKQTEVLEFYPTSEDLGDIGGLDNLKQWLNLRTSAFSDSARRYGLPNPRGVLLVGIQGTGKSLSAKAIAQHWRLPLLRLDVGRLMGSLVGESEGKAREMVRLAEAMAPAVLWLDELDKAFGGLNGGGGDSGTSTRVLATLITWMQEKTSPVFIVATANNIELLPPELLRKGRFDEIFFVGLPTDRERKEIFEVHLKRVREHSLRTYNLDRLVAVSAGFSGAEIQQAIVEAMHEAFAQQREFTTDDIVTVLRTTVPLSRTAQEHVDRLKAWAASGRARPASREEVKPLLGGGHPEWGPDEWSEQP
ncbi:MAG: family ATPase [Cyanobacteria bacterium RYN_339]|nr:family ATPase [Cyanobacteria bacterium RYN_339]